MKGLRFLTARLLKMTAQSRISEMVSTYATANVIILISSEHFKTIDGLRRVIHLTFGQVHVICLFQQGRRF